MGICNTFVIFVGVCTMVTAFTIPHNFLTRESQNFYNDDNAIFEPRQYRGFDAVQGISFGVSKRGNQQNNARIINPKFTKPRAVRKGLIDVYPGMSFGLAKRNDLLSLSDPSFASFSMMSLPERRFDGLTGMSLGEAKRDLYKTDLNSPVFRRDYNVMSGLSYGVAKRNQNFENADETHLLSERNSSEGNKPDENDSN